MDADTILNSLIERYSQCRSYQDRGYVKLALQEEEAVTFETTFIRGGQFRFDWKNAGLNFLTFDGRRAYLKEHYRDGRNVRGLSIGVHHASQGSCSAADYVPFLLMPKILPDRVLLAKGPYRLGTPQKWADVNYVLVYQEEGFTRELWIKKSNFALQKVVETGALVEDPACIRDLFEAEPELQRYAELPDSQLGSVFDKVTVFVQISFNEEIGEMAMKRRRPI